MLVGAVFVGLLSWGMSPTFFFFFFFLEKKNTNGSSQWHDYMSLNQHMCNAPPFTKRHK